MAVVRVLWSISHHFVLTLDLTMGPVDRGPLVARLVPPINVQQYFTPQIAASLTHMKRNF